MEMSLRPESRRSGMPGGLDSSLWATGGTGHPDLRGSSVHPRMASGNRRNGFGKSDFLSSFWGRLLDAHIPLQGPSISLGPYVDDVHSSIL